MQIGKYLNMTKSELQDEINRADAKIKALKEQIRLMRRLMETAKDNFNGNTNPNNGDF